MAVATSWGALSTLPPDAIFHLAGKAKAAPEPKANLVIGAYRDDEGKPYPLQVVRTAERRMVDMNLDHEYLPIAGHAEFIAAALKMLYADSVDGRLLVGVQTLSGTGALSLGAQLLGRVFDVNTTHVYISDPTWPNHFAIFENAGYKHVKKYRYYDPKTISLDFEGMKEDILSAPSGSIFVLHQCAHNPTGVDPTHAQWEELAALVQQKGHQVFFDSAYQGYASGNLDNDAYAARSFARKGIKFVCAQSFAKNMGLYGERVGVFSVVLRDPKEAAPVKSNLEALIRAMYSSPPAHGARVASLILNDSELRKAWEVELSSMAERIKHMRHLVYEELLRLQTPGKWDHIISQIGMFSFLGLSKVQCQYCQDHNVFITLTGRANMAGLTSDTALLLARTIDGAVRHCQPQSSL